MPTRLIGTALAALALPLAGCGGSSSSESASQSSTGGAAGPAAHTATSTPTSSGTAATAVGASGTSSASSTVLATANGVRVTLHATTHAPTVERPWPIHFTVTRAGRPARATVSYEYLFGGQVVAHRSRYTFTGHFSDIFKWPAAAVGYPLTFRAAIVCAGVALNLDYPVQVTR